MRAVGMACRARAALCSTALLLLTRTCALSGPTEDSTCRELEEEHGGAMPQSVSAQWLAAAFVAEANATQVFDCSQGGMPLWAGGSNAPYAAVCSDGGYLLLAESVKFTKGNPGPDSQCLSLLVRGFAQGGCNLSVPPRWSEGTYFLCSVEPVTEWPGACLASLNTQRGVLPPVILAGYQTGTGMMPKQEEVESSTCQASDGACVNPQACSTSKGDSLTIDLTMLGFLAVAAGVLHPAIHN